MLVLQCKNSERFSTSWIFGCNFCLEIEMERKDFLLSESREFVVDEDRKKIWMVLLDLLEKFSEVCNKNQIAFFADGGTLLGALRHHGFIPGMMILISL